MIRAGRKSSLHKRPELRRQLFPLEGGQQFDHALGTDADLERVFGSSSHTDVAEYFDRFI
jgi:hypothetical protein